MLWPSTYAWKRSGRISTSPALTALVSVLLVLRRRRRTTLCTRAMTSSGWQGLVIQSSAPSRSPRTRWATVEGPVQTTIPSSGSASQSRSSHPHACGPRTARSTTSALRRIDTTASGGTGLASTRCSQPRRSRRFVSTWMKPLSRSRTAIRREAGDGAELSEDVAEPSGASARTFAVIAAQCKRFAGRLRALRANVTGCSQEARYLRAHRRACSSCACARHGRRISMAMGPGCPEQRPRGRPGAARSPRTPGTGR